MFMRRIFSMTNGSRSKLRQRGFLMLEVSLALLIAGIAAVAAQLSIQRADAAASAQAQADNLNFIRDAAEMLVQNQYTVYQAGQPVSSGGVTLASGSASGQSLQPTVEQLKTMGLGVNNASVNGFYKSLSAAKYLIQISRVPAGCQLAPNPSNGAACNITGTVCFDTPVSPYGAAVGDVDGFAIGNMLSRLGGNGGASLLGAEANITGMGGGWSIPNPVPGAPAGIVCSRFGYGSSGLAAFVRVNDTRDPTLQGGMTVNGTTTAGNTLQVNGATTVTGAFNVGGATTITGLTTLNGGAAVTGNVTLKDSVSGLVCVNILSAGQIDVNCNGILNAKVGTFTGPFGTVKVGDTGTQYAVDTTGKIRGQQGFFSAVGSVFGDNTLGVRSAGSIFTIQTASGVDAVAVHDIGRLGARNSVASQALGLSDPVASGSPCAGPAVEVAATNVTNPATTVIRALAGGGLASCINSKWTAISQQASPGAACTIDGQMAISNADGVGLTCRNGVWMKVNDLLSSFVLMNTYRVFPNSIVGKPSCGQMGSGFGQAVPILNAQVESSTNSSFTRKIIDNGLTWTVVLQDSNGASLGGNPQAEALLMSYCYY